MDVFVGYISAIAGGGQMGRNPRNQMYVVCMSELTPHHHNQLTLRSYIDTKNEKRRMGQTCRLVHVAKKNKLGDGSGEGDVGCGIEGMTEKQR